MRTYTVTEYDKEDYNDYRQNLTSAEVINVLERIERGWVPDYNYSGKEDDFNHYKLHAALWYAIDLLKKEENEK